MGEFRPFLKWAGGKRQLLPELVARVQRLGRFRVYHEPFVGGGALFFELAGLGLLGHGVVLSDVNVRLMETYQGVRDHVEDVIALLQEHAARHGKDHYYQTRATLPATVVARAARIIYLNRTCFNGLYRENSRGGFNVPMGRYVRPRICDPDMLRAASRALQGARLEVRPFDGVLDVAGPGDLVYFDPPYVPVSETASFTSYARDGFGMDDQGRLASVFAQLARRGVHVMLSNSRTRAVLDLFEPLVASIPGLRIDTVLAGRAVNSRADRRGKVEEVVITNF